MNRLPIAIVLLAACALYGAAAAAQSPNAGPQPSGSIGSWDLERVVLVDGRELHGYIESEDPHWIHLVEIERPNNRPMFLVIRPIKRDLVVKIDRLDPQRRAKLQGRIEAFRNHARIEAARADAIQLSLVVQGNQHVHQYRGRWFTLETDIKPQIARCLIVRLEQVFTAYRQILPPREQPARPLRVRIFGSLEGYKQFLRRIDVRTAGLAGFVTDDNLVVAGSRINLLVEQLDRLKAERDRLSEKLAELEAEHRRRLKAASDNLRSQSVPPEIIRKLAVRETAGLAREVQAVEAALKRCSRANQKVLAGLNAAVHSRLAHEAFHAYLENYVYPNEKYDVPRWLNEGLAVMFEDGQLESETLRIDAPNRTALGHLHQDLQSGRPLRLEELLASRPADFLDEDTSNRLYAHSWGVVYYLTFQRGLLTGEALDRYVDPSAAEGRTPVDRFEQFVGMPLDEFEGQWLDYVQEFIGR